MILALDIGGSKIAAGLVKKNKILYLERYKWQGKITRQIFLDKIFEIIIKFEKSNYKIEAICFSVAGQVNQQGEVYLSTNLISPQIKIALKKVVSQKFKKSVFVENDAHCFTLGEAVFGKAKNNKIVLGLTLGSGIGGGLVVNKKIFRGYRGHALEVGHMIIEPGKEKCSCGKSGCWEAYASAHAMKKFYYKITGKRKSGFEISKEFKQKKKNAVSAIKKVSYWLALGMANLINILDPEIIVLGGGLSRFQGLISLAIRQIKKWLLISKYKIKIVTSSNPEKMALLGASLLKNLNKK